MLVTYKGTSSAMHVDIEGKSYRLVPSQPVEISDKQADTLKERKLIKVLVNAGEIEFGEPKAKEAPKAESKTTVSKKK